MMNAHPSSTTHRARVWLTGICELTENIGIPAPRPRQKGFSTVASVLENPRFSCVLGLLKLAAGIEA